MSYTTATTTTKFNSSTHTIKMKIKKYALYIPYLLMYETYYLLGIQQFNKSWRQHPTRHQLYGHLPPITKTIQVRWTRHAGHSSRSRDELIRDVLLWTPTHGRAKAGRPARTYIQQLCEDMGCCPEDLPRVMNDREEWRERVRDIRATSATWWWWWWSYLRLKTSADGPLNKIPIPWMLFEYLYNFSIYSKVHFICQKIWYI